MFEFLAQLFKNLFVFVGMVTNKSSFPPALTQAEEQKLLSELAAGNDEARDKLIEHNLRLVAHIAKKYTTRGRDADDLISIGTIGLIKAVGSFDPSKGRTLSAFAARCIENEILMSVRAEKKKNNEVSLDEPLGTDRDGNEITLADVIASAENPVADTAVNNSACRAVRNAAQSVLDERERTVIELRYGFRDGVALPQREVGKKLGISRSYVSRIEKRALAKLNRFLSGDGRAQEVSE